MRRLAGCAHTTEAELCAPLDCAEVWSPWSACSLPADAELAETRNVTAAQLTAADAAKFGDVAAHVATDEGKDDLLDLLIEEGGTACAVHRRQRLQVVQQPQFGGQPCAVVGAELQLCNVSTCASALRQSMAEGTAEEKAASTATAEGDQFLTPTNRVLVLTLPLCAFPLLCFASSTLWKRCRKVAIRPDLIDDYILNTIELVTHDDD